MFGPVVCKEYAWVRLKQQGGCSCQGRIRKLAAEVTACWHAFCFLQEWMPSLLFVINQLLFCLLHAKSSTAVAFLSHAACTDRFQHLPLAFLHLKKWLHSGMGCVTLGAWTYLAPPPDSFWVKKSSWTALVTARRGTLTTLGISLHTVAFLMHV